MRTIIEIERDIRVIDLNLARALDSCLPHDVVCDIEARADRLANELDAANRKGRGHHERQ